MSHVFLEMIQSDHRESNPDMNFGKVLGFHYIMVAY